jgi:hypothetical protein
VKFISVRAKRSITKTGMYMGFDSRRIKIFVFRSNYQEWKTNNTSDIFYHFHNVMLSLKEIENSASLGEQR